MSTIIGDFLVNINNLFTQYLGNSNYIQKIKIGKTHFFNKEIKIHKLKNVKCVSQNVQRQTEHSSPDVFIHHYNDADA